GRGVRGWGGRPGAGGVGGVGARLGKVGGPPPRRFGQIARPAPSPVQPPGRLRRSRAIGPEVSHAISDRAVAADSRQRRRLGFRAAPAGHGPRHLAVGPRAEAPPPAPPPRPGRPPRPCRARRGLARGTLPRPPSPPSPPPP